jgi:hypothetical protein
MNGPEKEVDAAGRDTLPCLRPVLDGTDGGR